MSDVLSWPIMWIILSNFGPQAESSSPQISHQIYATGRKSPSGVQGRSWGKISNVVSRIVANSDRNAKNTSVAIYNTYTTHSVSYWRAKWPSVHYKLHKHQQLPTRLVQATMSLVQSCCRLYTWSSIIRRSDLDAKRATNSASSSSRRMSFSIDASSKASSRC